MPRLTEVVVANPFEKSRPGPPPQLASCEAVKKLVFNIDRGTRPRTRSWGPTMGLDLPVMLNLSFPRLEVIELGSCNEWALDTITLLRHLVSPSHTTTVVLHAMCSSAAFLPALEQAKKLRRLTLTGLVFEDVKGFEDWCDDFRASASNHGARWRQKLEELYLSEVVFQTPWAASDRSQLTWSTVDMESVTFPLLKRFEVVEYGTSTSHNLLAA